jgi:hypothetical protein
MPLVLTVCRSVRVTGLTAYLNTLLPSVMWRCFVGWAVSDVSNNLMSSTIRVNGQHGVTSRKNWILSFYLKFIQFVLKTLRRCGFCAICQIYFRRNVSMQLWSRCISVRYFTCPAPVFKYLLLIKDNFPRPPYLQVSYYLNKSYVFFDHPVAINAADVAHI